MSPPRDPEDLALLDLEIEDLALSDLFTSFPANGAAGRMGEVIAALQRGDSLELRARDGRIGIWEGQVEVGRLSAARVAEWWDVSTGWRIDVLEVEVGAIMVMERRPEGTEPAPRWELVVPRVTYRRRRG